MKNTETNTFPLRPPIFMFNSFGKPLLKARPDRDND